MKTFRLLLAMLVVSLCTVTTMNARTAPTPPEAKTLESGKTYYLYNVETDRFLYNDSYSNVTAETSQGTAVKIAAVNGTQYTLEFVTNGRYLDSYNYNGSRLTAETTSYPNADGYRFVFTQVEGGYTIQRVYNAVDTFFVGVNDASSNYPNYVYSNRGAKGNATWQLLDVTETARFIAKRNLFRALEAADGYSVDDYEAVYNNETSTDYDLQEAADKLNLALTATTAITPPDWSDYNVLVQMSTTNKWGYYYGDYQSPSITNSSTELAATVTTDGDATLCFSPSMNNGGVIEVYLDDVLQYTIQNRAEQRYFVEMSSGRHSVKWKHINSYENSSSYCRIRQIGVERTPTIIVSLKEAGSLGTEVLYKTDHIANVRKLIVNGPMNSDDWARIQLMTSLFTLDLSGATVAEVPDETFYGWNSRFLHAVKLPNNLKRIGRSAFANTLLEDINFPDSLTTIGYRAFYNSRIKEAILPATLTTLETDRSNPSYTFANNSFLTKASLPASIVQIPNYCFTDCNNLQPFEIPEGITAIGNGAFSGCRRFNSSIPSSVTFIGDYAFENSGITDVVLQDGISLGDYAFRGSNLKSIVFPTTFYNDRYYLLAECNSLTDVTFQSPTMVTNRNQGFFDGTTMRNVSLHVPDYLVNHYKQDNYWYNCNVVGFPTTDIKDWVINNDLTLKEGERIQGSPNLYLNSGNYLAISGETAMAINDLFVSWGYYNSNYGPWHSQLLMTSDNITVEGKFCYQPYTYQKQWYFMALPFDFKVGDVLISDGASAAIRYYDGATRASDGTGGNWKNFSLNDTVRAGTGFIYQTSKTTTSQFTALNNESKQYGVSNKIFSKSLEANPSDVTADKGWNLVGNPWPCYYNIHKMNFVAPITVWDYSSRGYKAYSVIDDDYAIRPNEAFFVQCPDDVTSISFPIDGRQLDAKIESQNAAKPFGSVNRRRLFDLQVMNADSLADQTRIVVNDGASIAYETSCDASKFLSMDNSVPQLYSLGYDDTRYAINERPLDDATVAIGLMVRQQGVYTFRALRNDVGEVILFDHETGLEQNLSTGDYTFSASAGTFNNRFELRLLGGIVTEISGTSESKAGVSIVDGGINVNGHAEVYGIDGRKVADATDSTVRLTQGVYMVRVGGKTVKVSLK